jgi:protoporphyrinogen IX oxidase
MAYLWFKTLHIVFVVAWFAGLFYLPRLFVYHTEVTDSESHERFLRMERKLYRFTSLNAAIAALFALLILHTVPAYLAQPWLWAKVLLVLGLLAFHLHCGRLIRRFATHANAHSHVWYRWFNEIPTVFLILIVALVIFKPALS